MTAMSVMTNTEGKRELGTSLMFIGLGLWVADLLVVFFLPAAIKLGRYTGFLSVIGALALLGLVLMIWGYATRGKSEEE